jgi:hypothetical protein
MLHGIFLYISMSYDKIIKLADKFEEILKAAHRDLKSSRTHIELEKIPSAEIKGLKHLKDLLEPSSKEMPHSIKPKSKNPYAELLGKYDEYKADDEELDPEAEELAEEDLDLLGV